MKTILILLAVMATTAFGEATTEFTESGNTRRWVTSELVNGTKVIKADILVTYYFVNGHWYTETVRASEGVHETAFASLDGALILRKINQRDSTGVYFDRYEDTEARRFSTADRAGVRNGALDDRKVIHVYQNAFAYVYGDGSVQAETEGDKWIQSSNQLLVLEAVKKYRENRDKDPLSVKIAEMRYQREIAILNAIKASGR